MKVKVRIKVLTFLMKISSSFVETIHTFTHFWYHKLGDDMLDIDITSKRGILFITLRGSFTEKMVSKFQQEVTLFIQKIGIKNTIFNLSELNSISQKGLNELIKCYKWTIKNHGETTIWASPQTYLELNKTILNKITTINTLSLS